MHAYTHTQGVPSFVSKKVSLVVQQLQGFGEISMELPGFINIPSCEMALSHSTNPWLSVFRVSSPMLNTGHKGNATAVALKEFKVQWKV